MQAFITHPIRFESFCFTGTKFPRCDFDQPDAVREMIGPYTLKVTCYNAGGRSVKSARTPGRYAALVEIRHSEKVSKRFVTLCRTDGTIEAGIDPQVLEEREAELVPPQPDKWSPVLPAGAHDAVLAAGLHDLTAMNRAGEPLPADTLPQLDRQWWVGFKRHYYGYDTQYPGEFVCPRPVEGAPAPTIREGTLAQAGMKPDALKTIGAACEAWAKDTGIGFALCVVRRGVLVIDKAWGVQPKGPQQGAPFTTATAAPLASTTKFLSAILMAEFVDRGLIAFDEPAEKYVAALRGIAVRRPPTVRDLYLHTAGFTGHWGDLLNDMEEVVADLYPTLDVWATHRYQGVGHALGGKIMEMMSGESIPRLFRRHLFDPLGCASLRSDHTSYGSSGTATDLARIGQMMLNGGAYGRMRFTSPDVIEQMMPIPGKDRFEPDKAVRWGVGMKLFDSDGLSERHYGHSGAGGSYLKVDPAYDTVIAMARHDEGDAYHKRRAEIIGAIIGAIEGA
jgi:CubicO group peptidase (beta-lactamase class C family)